MDKYPKIPVDPHFTPTAEPLHHLAWLSASLGNDTFPIPLSGPAPIRHNPTPQGCTENPPKQGISPHFGAPGPRVTMVTPNCTWNIALILEFLVIILQEVSLLHDFLTL